MFQSLAGDVDTTVAESPESTVHSDEAKDETAEGI